MSQILERIHRFGPLSFAEYLDLALYGPDHGFFTAAGGAGRGGHFLTSPEVGPLFAAVLVRALDQWWQELGEPDPFVVVEVGAGAGTLARDILAATAVCAPALRYVLVERSESLRVRQGECLALEPPADVLGPAGHEDGVHDVGELPGPLAGDGAMVTSLADLPAQPVTGVVLANELLDNLPFRLLERAAGSWTEILVGSGRDGLAEVAVAAPASLAAEADRLAPDVPDGGRLPLQHEAGDWLRRALSLLERGRVVVVDYVDVTPSLARRPWRDWVRTYRGHARGGHPLERPGTQDISCEVAVDQLQRVRPLLSNRSQADFLVRHGIEELAAAARVAWAEGAAAGGLEAVRARSRLTEAAALVDPAGLGGFRVLQWSVG